MVDIPARPGGDILHHQWIVSPAARLNCSQAAQALQNSRRVKFQPIPSAKACGGLKFGDSVAMTTSFSVVDRRSSIQRAAP
jgi:hypothetical protein